MTEIRYILRYVKDLLSDTEAVWIKLRDPNLREAQLDYMLRYYYWPMMAFASLCVFLLHGNGVMLNSKLAFDAPFSFEYALTGMVSFALGFAVGPSLAALVLRETFFRFTPIAIAKDQLELFVHYSMSITMVISLFCAFLPNLKFLTFLHLYLIYVVWLGAMSYLDLLTSIYQRVFTIVATAVIFYSPAILQYILRLLFVH
ncbi:MAG: hypothetical protein KBT20_08130 [Bacteroidales bacterium]|nr:hypothetical protein [Candidatus Liminaster caballi]